MSLKQQMAAVDPPTPAALGEAHLSNAEAVRPHELGTLNSVGSEEQVAVSDRVPAALATRRLATEARDGLMRAWLALLQERHPGVGWVAALDPKERS